MQLSHIGKPNSGFNSTQQLHQQSAEADASENREAFMIGGNHIGGQRLGGAGKYRWK